AAGSGHEAMFRLLLSSGGDLEAKDLSGHTTFHTAVVHWRSQNTLRVLKSFGANIESKNHDGETPLQTAVRTQNAGLVKHLLIDAEANRDVVSKEGFT
ncbi:ankyrin, partial [Hyaloscypha variabilis F]